MASSAQAAKRGVMLAILLIAMADSHPQPEGTCSSSSSVESACAEKWIREYPSIDSDPPFKISHVCTHRVEHELNAHVYLHHTFIGQYTRQHDVLSTEFEKGFGSMIVADWLITEGPSRDTKVVAYAKGVHIQAGMDTENYYVSFNMVFDEGRFKGSTLQVMGTAVEKGEWAIVGGTGEFTLARGVIYKPYFEFVHDEGDSVELDIHCLYTRIEYPSVDIDPPFKISPVCTHRTEHELYAHLYLHQADFGQYMSQHDVLSTKFEMGFGSMVVNDWLITDGPSRDTKVVAYAKGVHIQAGMDIKDYYVSFNMVFGEGRFKGSTLQVMGRSSPYVQKGEWAIVGGTGEFTLARGVIYKPFFKMVRYGYCIELDIHCLYTPMEGSKGTSWTLEDEQSI